MALLIVRVYTNGKTFVICGSLTHREESIWDPPAAAISHSHAWDCHCPIYCRFSPRILSISYFCPRILLTIFFFSEYFWPHSSSKNTFDPYISFRILRIHTKITTFTGTVQYTASPRILLTTFFFLRILWLLLSLSFSLLLLVSYSFLRILGSLIPFSKYLTIYFLLRILLVSYFVLSLTNKILIIYLKWLNSLRIL